MMDCLGVVSLRNQGVSSHDAEMGHKDLSVNKSEQCRNH